MKVSTKSMKAQIARNDALPREETMVIAVSSDGRVSLRADKLSIDFDVTPVVKAIKELSLIKTKEKR